MEENQCVLLFLMMCYIQPNRHWLMFIGGGHEDLSSSLYPNPILICQKEQKHTSVKKKLKILKKQIPKDMENADFDMSYILLKDFCRIDCEIDEYNYPYKGLYNESVQVEVIVLLVTTTDKEQTQIVYQRQIFLKIEYQVKLVEFDFLVSFSSFNFSTAFFRVLNFSS